MIMVSSCLLPTVTIIIFFDKYYYQIILLCYSHTYNTIHEHGNNNNIILTLFVAYTSYTLRLYNYRVLYYTGFDFVDSVAGNNGAFKPELAPPRLSLFS